MTASAAGRTALITGGGNGLGRAIARALAGQGARVLLTGRHRDKLETVNAEIGAPSRRLWLRRHATSLATLSPVISVSSLSLPK